MCLDIAVKAHEHQIDKLGFPYVLHPIRVARLVGDHYILKGLAVLHDVDEDYGLDKFDTSFLKKRHRNVLGLLTHDKKISYKSYINGVLSNMIATKIKKCDVCDNLDPKRISELRKIDPDTASRLVEKYTFALDKLDHSVERCKNEKL